MEAGLDAATRSGPRRGKRFTYALLDERAPPEKTLARDEGLAVLALRYFASHGPAQIRDFAWWSGLTIADAKAGIAIAGAKLVQEKVEGKTYVFPPTAKSSRPNRPPTPLFPNSAQYASASHDHPPT